MQAASQKRDEADVAKAAQLEKEKQLQHEHEEEQKLKIQQCEAKIQEQEVSNNNKVFNEQQDVIGMKNLHWMTERISYY